MRVIIFIKIIKQLSLENDFEVTLNECIDGDTAWFDVDGKNTKVRFYTSIPLNLLIRLKLMEKRRVNILKMN
ncbi:hypothetical protein SD457_14790 [Coprobacillaceae bacterium CR2/5/TPMF4]|nr:hypothetical protein SD457_14790 [Coprobacillaceae bacterium CR2/5/TPMF4]